MMKRVVMLVFALAWGHAAPGNVAEDLFYGDDKPAEAATLYFCNIDANGLVTADTNCIAAGRKHIVVVTHGWFEREAWCTDTAVEIAKKVDANEWVCAYFDWRVQARYLNPTSAAEYARDTAGPMVAKQVLALSTDWEHVHLIGHSAGSWLINTVSKEIAKETAASIHLTFLDAYVPPRWDADELGAVADEVNVVYWSDHYFTRDLTMKATERLLKHSHNVDVSDITPGLKDHEFPRYWYPATVHGEYLEGRYEGKKLYTTVGKVEYGFARSLEAGRENWAKSLELKMGPESVKFAKPKGTVGRFLEGLFGGEQDDGE